MKPMHFVSLIIAGALVLGGCAKKPKARAHSPSAKVAAVVDSAASKKKDIFDEFYDEDKTKTGKNGAIQPKVKLPVASRTIPAASATGFSENGRYAVQVACVASENYANKLSQQFKDKGYPAYVAAVQNPTSELSGTYYRVRVGGFDGLTAAKDFGSTVAVESGFEYWVDKKSNDNVGLEGYGLGSGVEPGSSYESATPASSSGSTWGSSSTTSGSSWSAPASTSPAETPATPVPSEPAPAAVAPPAEPVAPAASAPIPTPAAVEPAVQAQPPAAEPAPSATPAAAQPAATPESTPAVTTPAPQAAPPADTGKSGDEWGTDDEWGK